MTEFTLHTIESAPEASRSLLAASERDWTFIPNLHRTLAESPEALGAVSALSHLFAKSSFSTAEQQAVYLSAIYINECEYCMAGHTVLAKMAQLPDAAVRAIRDNQPMTDARLEALRRFTQAMVRQRGMAGDAAVDTFLKAGFTKRNVLEVILAIAAKVISNYTNHVAHTPNDAFMKDTVWVAPSRRALVDS